MPQLMQGLIEKYIAEIQKIYGAHLRQVILYGSYARGDFREDSDVDIMIHPLYANIHKEGVILYGAA